MHKNSSSVADAASLNEKVYSPKATTANHNGNSNCESSLKHKKDNSSTSATNDDTTSKPDDALILRIGSLEKSARRLSSLSINRSTDNGDKIRGKIKVRTKTDPHPISSSQKLRDFSSSGTLTTVFTSTHSSSKCNCSSCKSMSSSVSNSDNHNKTKSVGTQHDANNAYDPWVRQTTTNATDSTKSKSNSSTKSAVLTQKLANTNAKVIVITDDFKKKALTNQEVFVDTKRKMLRYMKANKLTNSSRSMDNDNEPDDANKLDKQKAISKSVDNVSQLSTELDQLDNVGSVELIFISDEYLNKVDKPDVIILKNNSKQMSEYTNRKSKQSSLSGKANGSNNRSHVANNTSENGQSKKAVATAVADDVRRKSLPPPSKTIIGEKNRSTEENQDSDNGIVTGNCVNGNSNKQHGKLNRQSSGETSIDDVNNKLTSHAFQSYDEQEQHLESKEIQSPTTEDIST
ncbi:suppressor of Mek1 isoform X1 [Sitodiplosis mosellana]|uniref:suppressor of Mek1 isoform X1 n=1 Tax=Sitodiplosis mosellana TaxID=263140 RepID=UPI0024440564|nr:suppressor of Mek1 isoform X1 [Sitodiplosis mosellana]